MAPLKNTSSLLLQTRSLYAVSQLRLRNGTNATVFENWHSLNCCILRKAYFRQCSWHCLKTLRVCKSKHRLLIALFHWRCKSAAIRQSSPFDKGCGWRIYRKAYFRQCSWHCLKTLRVCSRANIADWRVRVPRTNWTTSKVHTLFSCSILWKVSLRLLTLRSLVNRWVCL